MNETPGRHLSEEQLLGFLDHELSRREFGTAREHLGTCWKCQTDLTELRETIAEFVRYQQKTSQVEACLGTDTWPDLRRRMRDVDQASEASRRIPGPGLRWGTFARFAVAGGILVSLALATVVVLRHEARTQAPLPIPSRTEAVAKAPASSAPISMIPSPRPTAVVPPLHVASAGGLRAEVGALVTLHELDADLGEPIRVESRPDGKVAVTGSGLSRERQAEIATALSNRDGIAVRFEQPMGTAMAPGSPARTRSVTPSNTALHAALEPVLGGSSEVEAFANAVVDESEEMMARAYALHNLTLRFPTDARPALNGDERSALTRIETDHRGKLSEHARRIAHLLETLRNVAAAPNAAVTPAQHMGLFESARNLDRCVNRTFGGEAGAAPLSQLLSDLLAASRQLDAALLTTP